MKVNIFRNGPGLSDIVAQHGSSTDWLIQRADAKGVSFDVVDAYKSPYIDPEDGDAWVVMGSARSVYDKDDWIDNLKSAIKGAITINKPILGICFGHQILAECLGGSVRLNHNGWELGTVEIVLTPDGVVDSLFDGFTNHFPVYESHQDAVYDLSPEIHVLAENNSAVQAFRTNGMQYGVQFHPEFYYDVALLYAKIRYDKNIVAEMPDVYNADNSKEIINNFLRIVIGDKNETSNIQDK